MAVADLPQPDIQSEPNPETHHTPQIESMYKATSWYSSKNVIVIKEQACQGIVLD